MSIEADEPGPVHLTASSLARLLRGKLPAEEADALIRHMAQGCDSCSALLAPLLVTLFDAAPEEGAPDPPMGLGPAAYELPVARSIQAVKLAAAALEQARIHVRVQLIRVLTDEHVQVPDRISPQERWAWCEALIEACGARRGADLSSAVELGQIAAELAEQLSEAEHPREVLADLRARAWAELANARRAADDLEGAETALVEAQRRLKQGTGDPFLLARVLDLAGSLFRAQRRFEESLTALDEACGLYLSSGETHFAGRVLINRALTCLYATEPDAAIRDLDQAFALLDLKREPALVLAAVHNTLLALVDMGDVKRAARLLWLSRSLYSSLGKPLDRVRLLGLEAKIALAQDQPVRAERLFHEEIAGFEAAGLVYDTALVSLDLAALLLEQGRAAEVLVLVDDMLDIFRKRGIRREAFAAVLLLREALARGEATAQAVQQVAERLRRLERGFSRGESR